MIDGGLESLIGVGLIPDADTNPAASLASAQDALRSAGLTPPAGNEQLVAGTPNSGIFVLPGGDAPGGLEDLLIDCAGIIYAELLASARAFVDSVDVDSQTYAPEDMREMKTPQGPVKAVVGAMSSVLKPGATIQVSILRDRWVSETTITAPRVAALMHFLQSLCGLRWMDISLKKTLKAISLELRHLLEGQYDASSRPPTVACLFCKGTRHRVLM